MATSKNGEDAGYATSISKREVTYVRLCFILVARHKVAGGVRLANRAPHNQHDCPHWRNPNMSNTYQLGKKPFKRERASCEKNVERRYTCFVCVRLPSFFDSNFVLPTTNLQRPIHIDSGAPLFHNHCSPSNNEKKIALFFSLPQIQRIKLFHTLEFVPSAQLRLSPLGPRPL